MEKQNEIVLEVLRRLSQAGILDRVLLIGSWAAAFYRLYFRGADYAPLLKTRDIDFLVAPRTRFPKQTDLHGLLNDLGFDLEFSPGGYMRLESDELIVEMLSPEVGPSKDRPTPLPELKFNAQPLRHLSMLLRDPITVRLDSIDIHLPHPADFALHKLIISESRKEKGKRAKDIESAYQITDILFKEDKAADLRAAYKVLSQKEKKRVRALLMDRFPEEIIVLFP